MEHKQSHRHHYIPRFLINKFCNDGVLWVYDKQEGNIRSKSPKQIFFGPDRNTVSINGIQCDNIEQIYSEIDNKEAAILNKILSHEEMSGVELTWLIYFAAQIKWRIPHADTLWVKTVADLPLRDMSLLICPLDPSQTMDIENAKQIENLEIIRQLKRLLLSLQPLLTENVLNEIHNNCYLLTQNPNPALIGDNPLIEVHNTDYRTLGDFIFPLSSDHTLICKRGCRKTYPSNNLFYLQKDLSILHIADRYVGCSDYDYLQKTVETYNQVKATGKEDLLLKYIFNFLP